MLVIGVDPGARVLNITNLTALAVPSSAIVIRFGVIVKIIFFIALSIVSLLL